MVYELNFSADDKSTQRFELLWQAFLFSGQGEQGGISRARLEIRLLEKLESVSNPDGEFQSGDPKRNLNPGGQKLVLDRDEYQMLQKRLDKTEFRTSMAKRFVDTSDWLASIKAS